MKLRQVIVGQKGGAAWWELAIVRALPAWPLSYYVASLLLLLLLPRMCFKIAHETGRLKEVTSVFGDNLLPTPWDLHDNQLGPHNRTWNRAWGIMKCSYPHWHGTSKKNVSIANDARHCPSYFHWIEKDLAPWKFTGITPINMEMAKAKAAFKVVILRGRLYVDLYYSCVHTRMPFTIWGILMLLQKYEGKIPDVEMMFDCMDRPHIRSAGETPLKLWSPAPLFRYSSDSYHYDIPWPDWSFWGWAETKLDPWEDEYTKIKHGSDKRAWRMKTPKAYWRGKPDLDSPLLKQLLQCNKATKTPQAEITQQNRTTQLALRTKGYKLETQCQHRYNIYAEGSAWSVSLKYILACGSATLAISPAYYDFFMRALQPGVHYVPVRPAEICAPQLCAAIDRAVRDSEKHDLKAIEIGLAGRAFVRDEISMSNVYDYMFHMITAYAKLQRYKPSASRTATLVTEDFILCLAQPHERLLLEKSRAQIPWTAAPCHLSKVSQESVKDFAWEAREQANPKWAQNSNCSLARPWEKGKGTGKGKGKGKNRKKKPQKNTQQQG